MNGETIEVQVMECVQGESALVELAELQLAMVGGGTGEVVIA